MFRSGSRSPFPNQLKALAAGLLVLGSLAAFGFVPTKGLNPPLGPLLPSTPQFKNWGLINTNNSDIDAPDAWKIEEGDSKIVVAVVDTGIDANHPISASTSGTTRAKTFPIYGWNFVLNKPNPATTTATARTSPASSARSPTPKTA